MPNLDGHSNTKIKFTRVTRMSSGINQLILDLEDFEDQIKELLDSVQKVLEKDMPKLQGQERVEVHKLLM